MGKIFSTLDTNHRLDLAKKTNHELVADNLNLEASVKELHASVLRLNNSLMKWINTHALTTS